MAHRFPRDTGNTRKGGRYDGTHQKARAAAARVHRPEDSCARCGQPLGPMGPWLHYDHTDDGAGYLGFSHAGCNKHAGAVEGNRRQRAALTGRRQSRAW